MKVAQSLFQMATQGKNVAAAIFWMKARAGWREKHEVKVSSDAFSDLTDADLHKIIGITQRLIEAEAEEQADQ